MFFIHFFNFKIFTLFLYILSIGYVHFRGKIRLKFLRQLTDHSSLLAPVNGVMYLFSKVPRTPFLDVAQFPELKILRDNWKIIRDEAEQLYNKNYITVSDTYDDIGFNSFFRRDWKRFYLKWYNDPLSSAKMHCPETVKLIQQIPNVNAAMFALLPKKSYLFKHRDPYAGSLRYHLGLITPNSPQCSIDVDGNNYFWKDGEDVLFDETYVHSAENATDEDRIILFCDIKRPLRSKLANLINHAFSNTIMKAAASKNTSSEKVGMINQLFPYLYRIRLVGKRLKNYNYTLYKIVKYSLFIGIFYCIFILPIR